jgi:Domain of unknown function (DUF4349)
MSQPDQESIVNEIRSARITASPDLRARVAAIAAAAPAAEGGRPRRELPWRRLAVVLVPACAAVAAAVALAVGLSSSGNGGSERAARGEAAPRATLPPAATADSKAAGSGSFGGAALPATSGRAQLYEAELTLKIADLSAATKRALRLTRDFDGYVRSVEYGSGSERGSAYLVVRVPVGSVQEALVRYSALGQILDQHVSIRDAQAQLDRRFRVLQAQRDLTAKLQAKLESPSLTAAERARLENRLVAARRQLVVLQKQQAALRRQTSYATVSLDLRSKKKAVVVPHEPGRIGLALHRSGQIVADEARVLVYVLVVGAPFFVLGAVALGGLSVRRRRREERLLATS